MTTFEWPYDGNTVSVVGSFTNWQNPIPMIKDPSGIFQIEIDLEPGTYDYKFIIDGRRWCYDILKPTKADERGNRNNVIIVDRGSGARGGVKKEVREVPKEAPKKEEKEEAAPETTQPESGRKERQQRQPRPQKERPPKGQPQPEGPPPEEVEKQQKVVDFHAAVRNAITAVKSYNAPWFCADLVFDDEDVTLPNVLEAVKIFSLEIPDTACMFFANNVQFLIVAAIVPFSKVCEFPAIEWVNLALSIVPGQPTGEGNDNLAHGIVQANQDLGIFPIKLKDLSRGSVFPILRKKGLIKDDDDDDDIPIGFDDI
jgi:hypothetical protein